MNHLKWYIVRDKTGRTLHKKLFFITQSYWRIKPNKKCFCNERMLRGNHFKNIQSLKFEKTSSNNANFEDQGVSAWRSKFFNAQVYNSSQILHYGIFEKLAKSSKTSISLSYSCYQRLPGKTWRFFKFPLWVTPFSCFFSQNFGSQAFLVAIVHYSSKNC